MSTSLRKALQILDTLRDSERDLSARELAALLGMPKSTVQRLLQALGEARMTVQEPGSRKYGLGPHTLTLGMAYRERLDLRSVALPHMRALRDATDETVGLSVAVGDERMFVEEVQSQSELRTHSELGHPYPLWSGAPGRVLLGALPPDQLGRLLDEAGQAAFRPVRPATRDGLLTAVAEIRRAGQARAFDETIGGVSALAVPVRDAPGEVVAALSVSGPSARMSEDEMDAISPRVLRAAAAISRALGAPDSLGAQADA